MIKDFIQRWKNKGDEKSDTQKFWLELIRDVLGMNAPENFIEFEKRVSLEHVSYIDAYIPSTGIIIEQKSTGISLDYEAKQSDGSTLSPFQQAKRYYDSLPYNQKGRYIITCNFREFRIYDMNDGGLYPKAKIIKLSDLSRSRKALDFLINPDKEYSQEEALSIKAGELTDKLFQSLEARYIDSKNEDSRKSLHVLCVRLVFLLYADKSGVFAKNQFRDYLSARKIDSRTALINLFEVLSLKPEQRSPYLIDDLKKFPFVNGGLFDNKNINIEIPLTDGEPVSTIIEISKFDWSQINPAIFGAIFESIFAKHETKSRDSEGMHYTSTKNIHKLIDPLFMDDINARLNAYLDSNDLQKLSQLQNELASLKFLDPACGSGNFLTETFISLRLAENKIIKALGSNAEIKVSINQFYGIEINDFAVNVAKTALWIANIQMLAKTLEETGINKPSLPLSTFDNIHRADALTLDWNEIITPSEKLFIIGNPPFAGYTSQKPEQKEAIKKVCGESASAGKIDYVCGWYYKAVDYIKTSGARAAFVSTNSIIQGDQVYSVWESLRRVPGFHIDFAYQSFKWDNEIKDKVKAHVYVVIIGFSRSQNSGLKKLFTPKAEDDSKYDVKEAGNINFYLTEGPDEDIAKSFDEALDPQALRMTLGSIPVDDGNLLMTHDEMQELITANPVAKKFIRPFMNGGDFINRKPRYCLWLVDSNPDDIAKCPRVNQRVKNVEAFRLKSNKAATRKKAETPALFSEIRYSDTNYIAVPIVSSEKRKYIPIDWLPYEIIPGGHLYMIKDAGLYHFGILTSRVHMAWMRRTAGRLEMRYSYSNTIVYNTFAWPNASQSQRAKIESTAQAVLDARAKFPDTSFANLYNHLIPPELRRAHELNDNAVCEAYGWDKNISEDEIITRLFVMYHELVKNFSERR
ncbi:MAG: class I SAM-dependent DNA methyltransferase [Synergistaceae bacterium]|nr:class I SAM-dependent DNA methyltransferase [Synergistaceae bacterium]